MKKGGGGTKGLFGLASRAKNAKGKKVVLALRSSLRMIMIRKRRNIGEKWASNMRGKEL